MLKKILQTMLSFLCLFFFAKTKLMAEEKPDDMGLFSIDLLPAKGQDTSIESYYEFDVSEGLDSSISIRVLNHQDKEIQVEMTVSQAMTNHYGYIQYNRSFEADNYVDSVQKISDYISPSKEQISIAAREDKIIKLDLSVPKNVVRGNVLAGISFKEVDEKKQTGIASTYSYVLALVLKDSPGILESSEQLNYQSSELVEINHRPFLQVELDNPEAKVLDDLSLDIRLKHKDKELLKHQKDGLQMAPETKMRYTIPLNELKVSEQDVVEIVAESHGHTWHFKSEISPQLEKSSLKKTVNKKKTEPVFGLLIIFVMAIIYTIKRIGRRNV